MRGALLFLVAMTSALGAVVACSSESRPPPGTNATTYTPGGATGTGSTNEGGSSLDGGDGGACNTLPITGNIVDAQNVQGDPPSQTGGAIANGVYDITAVVYYVGTTGIAGPAGVSYQGSIDFESGVLQRNVTSKDSTSGQTSAIVETYNAFAAEAGATVQLVETCPLTGIGFQQTYTATATTLTIVDPANRIGITYTHR